MQAFLFDFILDILAIPKANSNGSYLQEAQF